MRRPTADRLFFAALAAVVLWRLFTAWYHQQEVAAGDLDLATAIGRRWLAGMGLVHALFAGWARARLPTRAGRLYSLWALCTALHWGWLPDLEDSLLRSAMITLYFVLSGMLSAAFILRFTLALPPERRGADGRKAALLIYSPPALGLALAVAVILLPSGSPPAGTTQALFWGLEAAQSSLYGLAALGILVHRWFVATPAERKTRSLTVGAWLPLLGAAPWLLSLAGVTLPLPGHLPPTFFFILIPPALAACLAASESSSFQAGEVRTSAAG